VFLFPSFRPLFPIAIAEDFFSQRLREQRSGLALRRSDPSFPRFAIPPPFPAVDLLNGTPLPPNPWLEQAFFRVVPFLPRFDWTPFKHPFFPPGWSGPPFPELPTDAVRSRFLQLELT